MPSGVLPIIEAEKPDVECYETFVPITRLSKEKAHQQKLGGSCPMFFDGDKGWPMADDQPMQFIAQFIDPRPPHRFVRLFVSGPLVIEEERKHASLQFFDLTKACQKQGWKRDNVPSQEIVGWVRRWEVWNENFDEENFNEMVDRYTDFQPYDGLKLGGVGNTCQGILYNLFIQNIHAFEYGDSGSIHISATGELEGDMC